MDLRNIKKIAIGFSLFDENQKPVNQFPVLIQYFGSKKSEWISIFQKKIDRGKLSVDANLATDQKLSEFLNILKSNIVPEFRIISENKGGIIKKTQVVSNSYAVSIGENKEILMIDFGSAFLGGNQLLEKYGNFKDFNLIASPFPIKGEIKSEESLQQLNSELLNTKNELVQISNQKKKLEAEFQDLLKKIEKEQSDKQKQGLLLEKAQNESIKSKENEAKLNKEIESLKGKIENLSKDVKFETRPMPLNDVYNGLVKEIDKAENENHSNFKLTNMSVKLKTMVNRDDKGLNLQFFDLGNVSNVNGNAISEVQLDISPAETKRNLSEKLPNLIGYTESAVRQILNNLSLRLNPVYQKKKNIPSGDSFKQIPLPKSDYLPNDTITIIFSKNE